MTGPITRDMVDHFVDRWNFIFKEKYNKKNPGKYHALELPPRGPSGGGDRRSRGEDDYLGGLTEQFSRGMNRLRSFGEHDAPRHSDREHGSRGGNMPRIQMIRSCAEWSSGHPLERSIQTAYIQSINEAKHFIYIENQFFITATDDKQRVVKNKIGAALVDRIIRADHEGQPFHVWVLMPAVPAFAGDLHDDGALGTRAIMEFQYDSISRGGYSIIEKLLKAGIRDPSRYIGFYNLRNFDRINTSKTMAETEARTGVSYEDARKEKDRELGGYPEHSSERRRMKNTKEAAAISPALDKVADTKAESTEADPSEMSTTRNLDGVMATVVEGTMMITANDTLTPGTADVVVIAMMIAEEIAAVEVTLATVKATGEAAIVMMTDVVITTAKLSGILTGTHERTHASQDREVILSMTPSLGTTGAIMTVMMRGEATTMEDSLSLTRMVTLEPILDSQGHREAIRNRATADEMSIKVVTQSKAMEVVLTTTDHLARNIPALLVMMADHKVRNTRGLLRLVEPRQQTPAAVLPAVPTRSEQGGRPHSRHHQCLLHGSRSSSH
ncbi:hypothetical protein NXS19_010012 [Fusarium pseudograminearum]|nr:hypothetical protein NXS19_010012 [Fusarium pseudograminearum]